MSKLDWSFDNAEGCEIAHHNGYRILAKHDDSPENPFENWDGNWPMIVRYDRHENIYDKVPGVPPAAPLDRFSAAQLVHDQHAIAKALDTTVFEATSQLDEPTKYCRDVDDLRRCFEDAVGDVRDGDRFDMCKALYDLLGIPALSTTSRGCNQGDYAELLIVATPEARQAFHEGDSAGWTPERWQQDLQAQADLYGAWAWGYVYGYVIEKREPATYVCSHCQHSHADEVDNCVKCGELTYEEEGEWVEIEDGSCWGYYGTDHAKSGLEEAALECIPDEPVRSSDNVLENS